MSASLAWVMPDGEVAIDRRDKALLQLVEHEAARHPADVGHREITENGRRQQHMAQCVAKYVGLAA